MYFLSEGAAEVRVTAARGPFRGEHLPAKVGLLLKLAVT